MKYADYCLAKAKTIELVARNRFRPSDQVRQNYKGAVTIQALKTKLTKFGKGFPGEHCYVAIDGEGFEYQEL